MHTIEIPMAGGVSAEAYAARGGAADDCPGVLFFMDAIGLRPQIAEMCQRIAEWGYVVLAPNVFHRNGRAQDLAPSVDLRQPGERGAFFRKAMPRVRALTAALAQQDIPVYLAALRELPGVSDGPVAATGYCMGARLSVRAGNLDSGVAAVGAFHGGRLATDDDDSPHRGLSAASAEFVFGHADKDRSMPRTAVAALGAALDAAGLTASNEIYQGAPHGYTMADTPMYDEPAAERHFAELEALLGRQLA